MTRNEKKGVHVSYPPIIDAAIRGRSRPLRVARARAFANLALVKYFGKRDIALNLPAAGSLSLTLSPLATTTKVEFSPDFSIDEVFLGDEPAGEVFGGKVKKFLDVVCKMANCGDFARVSTSNNFPTAAGLASSASGFAALALAATKALGLDLDEPALSALARLGSGSAARSITGGISVWQKGVERDGSDSYSRSILGPDEWDLRVVVGVTELGEKATGSTEAMERTRLTSPYYDKWIESCERDLEEAIQAVESRDFTLLGEITERSALGMHAAAFAARPGIVFWKGATLEVLHLVRDLRAEGREVYFTCDAGPQPKVLCLPSDEEEVAAAISQVPGVVNTIRCTMGHEATLLE